MSAFIHRQARVTRLAGLLLAGSILAGPALARDGDPDRRFGQDGVAFLASSNPNDRLRPTQVVAQPDGKLLLAGSRDRFTPSAPFDPHALGLVVRLNPDGSADASFGSDPADPGLVVLPDLVVGTALQVIEAMQVLGDGSILVAGTAQAFGPLTGFVVKLAADGSVDRDFGDAGVIRLGGARFNALAVDSRGRIVVAGELAGAGGISRAVVARYTAAGAPDAAFGDRDGQVLLGQDAPARAGFLRAVHVGADDGLLVAGSWAEEDFASDAYWIHRLDASGAPDPGFGDGGRRVFRLPDSSSTVNGIGYLVEQPSGHIVFAGHHEGADGVGLVVGRLHADGTTDVRFGDGTLPGYARIAIAPDAWNRYPSGLVRQSDGRLVLSASYATGGRSQFIALRLTADGRLDPSFADGGIATFDLAAAGVFSDATALTLAAGQPVVAGAAMRSAGARAVDLAVVKLENDGVFREVFDEAPAATSTVVTIGYDELAEGFRGPVFVHGGTTWRDVNGVDGTYPDGKPFVAGELGTEVIVEDARMLFDDFPTYGSAPNLLTFGTALVPGANFTVGPLSSAQLDLDTPAVGARLDLVHYENGPWGGIEVRLEAYFHDSLVGSASFTIAGGSPGRDNLALRTLAIEGATFDTLRLKATLGGTYTAPRIMLDNLRLTRPVAGP